MRFYYQAQDLGSGQKVGHVQIFSGHNKSVPHSRTLGLCSIVMRFLFLEILIPMFPKVATKCIRVSSTATNKAVIETLIEKFRPDMKMLEVNFQF